MFDHVQIKVEDLAGSRAFYDAALKSLGHSVVLEIKGVVVGYGPDLHNMFEVRQAGPSAPVSKSTHVAFVATTEAAVQDFHSTTLAHGATDNGAPGFRTEYEEGYYSAFVIDPNGHNLEAVFQSAQVQPG